MKKIKKENFTKKEECTSVPMFGCKVVKGYGAILGRAFESAFSRVDLPAFIREEKGSEGKGGEGGGAEKGRNGEKEKKLE